MVAASSSSVYRCGGHRRKVVTTLPWPRPRLKLTGERESAFRYAEVFTFHVFEAGALIHTLNTRPAGLRTSRESYLSSAFHFIVETLGLQMCATVFIFTWPFGI